MEKNMKNTIRILGLITVVIVICFCATTVHAQQKTTLEGTWSMGIYELVILNNGGYIYKENGTNSTMGHITFTANQITLNDTSEWNGAQWIPTTPTVGTFGYTITGNTLVLRNNTLWPFLNGTWTLR